MTTNDTTSPEAVVRSAGVDERAWLENQALADTVTTARNRLEAARAADQPAGRIRRLERDLARASEAIYLANRGLARRVAGRYTRRTRDPDDLYQVADEALWTAICRWDPTASPLGAWAYRYVEKACRVHVARSEHGLSNWSWQHRPQVLAAARELAARGEAVTVARVAELAGVTVETASVVLDRDTHGPDRSLDVVVGDGTTTLGDMIAAAVSSAGFDDPQALATVATLLDGLDSHEWFVWLRTTGADNAEPVSTEALESVVAKSAETVRRMVRRCDSHIADVAASIDRDRVESLL